MRARFEAMEYALPQAGGFAPLDRPREAVYVFPGQVYVSAKPARVTTILGSCITVCLFDRGRRIGGMNHFMLPHHTRGAAPSGRFGDMAMTELLAKMTAAGARIPFLEARIFGGSCMFAPMQTAGHLGQKNEQLAREALAAQGIPIVEADTGGARGRKLIFHTDEGKAWLTSI
jgi:chemotaxis protein CheD